MTNYYETLQVSRGASFADIKSSYNRLVKIYYPDKDTGDAKKFEEIVQAYNILKNKVNKSKYDESIADHFTLKLSAIASCDTVILDKNGSALPFEQIIGEEDDVDLITKLQDLELARGQDDIEFPDMPLNLLSDNSFDINKFNELYEKNNNLIYMSRTSPSNVTSFLTSDCNEYLALDDECDNINDLNDDQLF